MDKLNAFIIFSLILIIITISFMILYSIRIQSEENPEIDTALSNYKGFSISERVRLFNEAKKQCITECSEINKKQEGVVCVC